MATLNNQPKNNNQSTLNSLLKTGEELKRNQDDFGQIVDAGIRREDARTKNDNSTRDSRHRSKIALIFTWSFVIIMAIIVIFVPFFNATIGNNAQIDQNRLLEVFCSSFGTILGFVLGYYFKDKNDGGR